MLFLYCKKPKFEENDEKIYLYPTKLSFFSIFDVVLHINIKYVGVMYIPVIKCQIDIYNNKIVLAYSLPQHTKSQNEKYW